MFADSSDAPRAGADLRTARERLGWTLPDVASMLRIRASYLEALEAGRLSHLPGNVYALGFLRGYARALGLDSEEVVRRFKGEAREMDKDTELVFPMPAPERGLPAGALILLGLVLVGGAYAGWYRLSGEGKLPPETVAPVPARLAPLAEQAVPGTGIAARAPAPTLPQAQVGADEGGQFEPRQAAAENPLFLPEPAPQVAAQAPVPAVEAEPPPVAPISAPTTANAMPVMPPRPAEPAPKPAAAPAAPAMPDNTRILLRFTGDTWLQVRERGNGSLISKLMKAGDSFPIPARPNILLTTGNAGQTEIVVDGEVVPPLGAAGSVRKDVLMDPDQLKAGTAAPVSTRR